MTKDEILKMKAAVLYILGKSGEMDFIHLFKILYFAERRQYAEYGQHLIHDSFCALERGPVPSLLYDVAKKVVGMKFTQHPHMDLIADALTSGSGECHYMLKAVEAPDMDELSEAEITAIDLAYDENVNKNINQLSADSHDLAWTDAWAKSHNSAMDTIKIAKAGGASDEFLRYIRESEILDSYIKG